MKKLFVLLLLGVFMLSFVSAFEFDNIKNHKETTFDGKQILGNELLETYKPIEIKNIFGLGSILFEGYLSQHDDVCGINCQSTMEIKLHQRGVLIDDISFYSIGVGGSKVEESIDYQLKYLSEVDNYKQSCESIYNASKDYYNLECEMVLDGTKLSWVNYNLGDELDAGIYTIKLEGRKSFDKSIDWVIETNGETLESWAWWNSLEGNFEIFNTTGLHNFTVPTDVTNVSVLVVGGGGSGAGGSVNDAAGGGGAGGIIFNDSYEVVPGTNISITVGAGGVYVSGNGVNGGDSTFGIHTSTGGGGGGVGSANGANGGSGGGGGGDTTGGSGGTGTQSPGYGNDGGDGNDAGVGSRAGGGGGGAGGAGANGVTGTPGAGGTFITIWGQSWSEGGDGGGAATAGTANTGNGGDGGQPAAGGNGGSGIVIVRYILGPSITTHYPIENSNHATNTIITNATVTDDFNITKVELYVDGVLNQTNSSNGVYNDNVFTFPVDLSDGTHNIYFNATNNFSLSNKGATISFTIDTGPPSVVTESPTGTLDYNYIGNTEDLNVTFTDINLDFCWYDYNGTNISIEGCQTGIKNSTNFTLEENNFNITIWANDTLGQIGPTFIEWNYTYLENNRTHNTTSYETAGEIFSINVEGPTSATLFYNGTEYTTTKSGDDFTRTIQMIAGQLGNHTVYWRFDNTQNSKITYQGVSETVFTLCNATYDTPFLNISFKDESDLSVINASIPTSTFVYWLGDGTITKTLTFINTSVNFNYEFCATPNRTFNFNSLIQYKQGSAYPQRIFSQTGSSLTNTTTDITLYLLGVSDGLFVTFQVFGGQSNALEDVSVTGTRVLEGSDQTVAQGTTDAAGTVTFWLNPDFLHTFTYIKTGFETVIESLFPTQTLYTVTMGGGTAEGVNDTAEGVVITTLPQGSFLDTNTFYTFAYTINSSSLDLSEFGFELFYNNGTSIHSDTSTTITGGTLDKSFNTSNESRLSMTYYYITDGTRINGTTYWLIYEANDFSIYHLLTRVGTYISADIFGILGDDEGYFAKAMLSITILILVTGSLSMRYGIASEAAVTGLLFGVIFMLNVFNLIPTPDFLSFIELGDFLVFLIALVGIVQIIKEEGR